MSLHKISIEISKYCFIRSSQFKWMLCLYWHDEIEIFKLDTSLFISGLKIWPKLLASRIWISKITYIAAKSLNTYYLTDLYIVFTLKMESVSKNIIFCLKMTVKSGLEKNILKFLHAQNYFFTYKKLQNCKFSNKKDLLFAWRDLKKNVVYFHHHL